MSDISRETVEQVVDLLESGDCKLSQPTAARMLRNLLARVDELEEQQTYFEGMLWRDGEPDRVYRSEWFIAKTKNREKVVLRALPEEHSYDYRTADDRYLSKDHIIAWMQFPDSEFIPFDPAKEEAVQRGYQQGLDTAAQIARECGVCPETNTNSEFYRHGQRIAREIQGLKTDTLESAKASAAEQEDTA